MASKLEDVDDVALWPAAIETHFITLLQKESKKSSHPSNLDKKTWKAVNDDMSSKFGKSYTIPKLKAKYNRLRRMHRDFSDLLAQTCVHWDPATNIVHAADGVWEAYLKKNPTAKRFRKKGCNHYDMLGEIFNNRTLTSQLLHYASTHSQSGSEDKDRFEEPETGVHMEAVADIVDTNESGTSEAAARRRAISPLESSRPTKQPRGFEHSKLDDGEGAWTKDSSPRAEEPLLRTDQSHRNEMLPSGFDPYSVPECMDKLESIPNVENVSYFRAMERFLIPEWRQMFIKMSEPRRHKWLESLKN